MDLIVFGTVYLEVVFGDLPALPRPGQEIYTDEFAFSVGGAAVTVATAASRLGVLAGMSTLLGDDLGSRVAEQHCRRAGVDMTACRYVAGPVAGVSVAVNFAGDRAFISHLPPRPAGERRDIHRWLEVLREHRPRWCYVHAGTGVAPFVREARALGAHVALAVAHNDIDDDAAAVVDCVREADIFLTNEPELIQLTEATSLAQAMTAATGWCPCVVVTRGADGAVVATPGKTTHVTDGVEPVRARDRTGAGDAFAGALLGALCQGASITEAAVAGNAAGSRTVTLLGAVGAVEVEGLSGEVPIR
jgi:sugar/nucleoside kinase (ribokinase family)